MAEHRLTSSLSTCGGLSLVVARSPHELREIRAFRRRTYRERSSLVVDDSVLLDRRSFVFGIRQDTELIACGRVLPLPDPAAGLREFQHPRLGRRPADTEISRLAVSPGRSPLVLLATLGLGAHWMLRNTVHRDYIAFCNAKLVPAYERVGAQDLGLDLGRRGSERRYRIVAGRFDVAATEALSLLSGWVGTDHLSLTA
jgi:hypothetical protein